MAYCTLECIASKFCDVNILNLTSRYRDLRCWQQLQLHAHLAEFIVSTLQILPREVYVRLHSGSYSSQ